MSHRFLVRFSFKNYDYDYGKGQTIEQFEIIAPRKLTRAVQRSVDSSRVRAWVD